jgi:hypothetical protein
MYLLTLLSPMSMASLSSSPRMRGAPQPGFSRQHLADQISDLARNERSSGLAAPHLPGPEQTKANASQAMTVSGLAMARAERQSLQMPMMAWALCASFSESFFLEPQKSCSTPGHRHTALRAEEQRNHAVTEMGGSNEIQGESALSSLLAKCLLPRSRVRTGQI